MPNTLRPHLELCRPPKDQLCPGAPFAHLRHRDPRKGVIKFAAMIEALEGVPHDQLPVGISVGTQLVEPCGIPSMVVNVLIITWSRSVFRLVNRQRRG